MCVRRLAFAAIAGALAISSAVACGPDFPQNLLDDRKASLLELPDGSFAYEASHLLPKPVGRMRAVDDSPWEDPAEVRAKAEAEHLTAAEIAKVRAMRAAQGLDAARAAGEGLPPELLDYTLGAIAFKGGDMATARAHFERVLALAPPLRPRRDAWSLYMRARTLLAMGITDTAFATFDQLRERVNSGAWDPTGLAVASYGEQARVQWHRGNVARAVALYATQAAHGSQSGVGSLLFVARSLLAHPDLLDKALDDPLSQRLLAAYLFTRSDEFGMAWPAAGSGATDGEAPEGAGGIDVDGFLAAIERHGAAHVAGLDRLAAGAYRSGHFELAARFAAKSTTPLAAWVRAKLALRAGDEARAGIEYAAAVKGFPVEEQWTSPDEMYGVASPRCRVESERGVLALSRGDFVEALSRLSAGARERWPDAAYVAERVLTVDELEAFVDRQVHAVPFHRSDDGTPPPPAMQLRALLARRLLREGRDDEALRYFDDPALRAKATALIAARHDADAWGRTKRAQALFRQALLVRRDGMDLLGTELAPDDAIWGGSYAVDAFPLDPSTYVGFAEPGRVRASAPIPNQRFHYRFAAVGLAEQAAGLVPERSQAYAAVLCSATSWIIDLDPHRATALYHRYLRDGAWVPWGRSFGKTCPAPDFEGASRVPWRQAWWATRDAAKRAWWLALVGIAGFAGWWSWRRRRRALRDPGASGDRR